MDVIDGESSAFLEERAEDLSVDLLAGVLLVSISQKGCLEREVSAQRAVASAYEDVFLSCLLSDLIHYCSDLFVSLCCLLCGEASGVCQDVEQIVLFFESVENALFVPSRVDCDVMDRLYSCRVVIEHDYLLIISSDLCVEQSVDLFYIDWFEAAEDFCTDCHIMPPVS